MRDAERGRFDFLSRQRDYGGSEIRMGGGNKNLFGVVSEIEVPLCGSIDKQVSWKLRGLTEEGLMSIYS